MESLTAQIVLLALTAPRQVVRLQPPALYAKREHTAQWWAIQPHPAALYAKQVHTAPDLDSQPLLFVLYAQPEASPRGLDSFHALPVQAAHMKHRSV